MIRLITATPGSGKTCLVVEWLLKEIDKQTNPVMYGWRCPVCGRVYSPYVSMCAY